VAASILSLLVLNRIPRAVPALVLLPVLAAIALLPAWPADRFAHGTFRLRKTTPWTFLGVDKFFENRPTSNYVFHDDDPTSSVSVGVPFQKPENIALFVNGKPEGALVGDYPTMALTALIPALIAERHERGFVIGLGTGVTAGEFAALEGTRKVTVAEISRAVIVANPLFNEGNLGASTNPKIELIRGDAYRTLLRSTERYDVIVSEPSNPWVAGVEMLYTREFLEAARSRLAPGGVYAQWFHVYETDREVVNLILRTYASVFPRVSVWYMSGPDLLVLGMDRSDRALDVHALESRFRQPDFTAAFDRVGIDRFPQLLAHELIPLGTLHAEELEGPIHTLRRPILSDLAARAFFYGGPMARVDPYMSENHQKVSVGNSLLRRYAGGDEVLPEEVFDIAAREMCRFKRARDCASFVARWSVDHPKSDRRRAALPTLRKKARPRDRNSLSKGQLEKLSALHSGRFIPSEDAAPPLVEVRRQTFLFLNYYSHVVPFDRRAMEEVWGRCGGEDCEVERARAEKLLWGLDGSASR
jgi:hypothetical protein